MGILFINTPLYAIYYYYKGNKIPIEVNNDSIVVYVASKFNSTIVDIEASTIALNSTNDKAIFKDKEIVAIGYIAGNTVPKKMSNSFYIKLYEYADTIILNEVVKTTKTHLIGNVPYMDRWYKIMVANSTIDNSLEMSNYFYETGLFADVDPGFILDFKPSCVSDSELASQWALSAVNACDAWTLTKGNPNIRVAVVDMGIDMNHQEFTNSYFYETSYDCELDLEVNNIYDYHGTSVAGVINSNHNYGKNAGIAPNVTIMPVSHSFRGIEEVQNSPEQLASGISWAVQNGADIINCSWGLTKILYDNIHTALLEDAILTAINNGRNNKGCIVVFASGNFGIKDINYPACFTPEILAVGAQSSNDKRFELSCYGKEIDVVAPGYNIYTLYLNNEYHSTSGTSFAAPYVSGIAALILSINPDLTREEVVNIIETTAQRVGGYDYSPTEGRPNGKWHEQMGYGLVDAYAAVLAAKITTAQINGPEILSTQSTYSVTNIPTNASITWTYTYTPDIANTPTHLEPITFVNGNSTSSVLIKREKYLPTDIEIGPIIPEDTITIELATITPSIQPRYFTGTVVLKATITSGGYTYVMTKTINLPSSDTEELHDNEVDIIIDSWVTPTEKTNILNENSLSPYQLTYKNPVTSKGTIVSIEYLSDLRNEYIPYNGNSTIEIWHHQLGLVKRLCDTTSNLYLDCGDLPTGVYQMILIINGEPVAQSKLIKL